MSQKDSEGINKNMADLTVKSKKKDKKEKPKQSEGKKQETVKKQTKLGIETKKDDNYSEWYSQVNFKANFIFV